MGNIMGSWSGMRKHLEQDMLAILGRRTGRRTLVSLKESITSKPQWLQMICRKRLEADQLL